MNNNARNKRSKKVELRNNNSNSRQRHNINKKNNHNVTKNLGDKFLFGDDFDFSNKILLPKNDDDLNIENEESNLDKTEVLEFDFIDDDYVFNKHVSDDIEILEDFGELKKTNKTSKDNKKSGIELFFKKLLSNKSMMLILLVGFCAFVLGFSFCFSFTSQEPEVITKIEEKIVNDENIVFLGDSIFWMYDVEKYFKGRHVVNSGISGHKTTDVLKDMNNRVYRYNPSMIFIMIGTNDVLDKNLTNEDTVANIGLIIDDIKKNRPSTVINVVSLFPINNSDDDKIDHNMVNVRNNQDITKMNSGIKKICKDKKVTYIDVNTLLLDDNKSLDIKYTTEGLHINPDGYEIITDKLIEYIK